MQSTSTTQKDYITTAVRAAYFLPECLKVFIYIKVLYIQLCVSVLYFKRFFFFYIQVRIFFFISQNLIIYIHYSSRNKYPYYFVSVSAALLCDMHFCICHIIQLLYTYISPCSGKNKNKCAHGHCIFIVVRMRYKLSYGK